MQKKSLFKCFRTAHIGVMNATTNAPFDRPTAGIVIIVGGLFLFSLQDLVIKFFSDRYSVLQIVFIRAFVAVIVMLVAVLVTTGVRGVIAHRPGLLMLRGLLGFLSYLGYYLAIAALPLAEVVAIVFAAPIFVTVLAMLFLKERVGPRRWLAVLVGFVAVLIVVGPSAHIANLAAVLAMFAALTYACSTLITRFVTTYNRPWTVSLYAMAVFLIGSAVASLVVSLLGDISAVENPSLQFLVRPWVMPATIDVILMLLLGVNAAVGFYCITKAYSVAPLSVVAPFEYTYIVWAVLFGYLLWSEVPEPTTILGVTLLIASSLYILHREISGEAQEQPGTPAINRPLYQAGLVEMTTAEEKSA